MTAPENPDTDAPSGSPGPDPEQRLQSQFGDFIHIASRFNLEPRHTTGLVADIVPRDQHDEQRRHFGRLLVVESGLVNPHHFQSLVNRNVPHLPQLEHQGDFLVFGVMDGLKPLAYEGYFSGISSSTYISDQEIFNLVGVLNRDYYDATGALLLDGESDSPLNHLAIKGVVDERQPILYFYPPYSPSSNYQGIDQAAASTRFGESLRKQMSAQIELSGKKEHIESLMRAASEGFINK